MKDLKDLFHLHKDHKRSKDDTAETTMGTRPGDVPHTGLQPGIDQTLEGGPGQAGRQYSKQTDSHTASAKAPVGRAQLLPKAPALYDDELSPKDVKADIAKPPLHPMPQDNIAPTSNLPGVADPMTAGYSPLQESAPVKTTPAHTSGLEAVKPPITDVGTAKPSDFTFSSSTSTGTGAASKPSDGAAGNQEAYKGEMEPLVKKAFPDELDHIKPKEAPVGKMGDKISKADIGAKADREIGNAAAGKADTTGRLDTSSTSQKSDFTTALDKIADSTGEATSKATDSTKGVAATAAEYITSGARAVAETARQVQDSADQGNLTSDAKATAQVAGDKVKETGRTVQDAAAQGLGSAQEALDTKNKPSDGTGAAGVQKREYRTTPAEDGRSMMDKTKDALQGAAAIVSDKTSQAYQMAQQKLQETGLPQKLADHSAAAQETAQKKLDEYFTEAQAHAQVAQDLAAQKLAEGKFHAQEAARISKEKAAELASNVQNMSAEDVNRSTVGRSMGGILLLWLASYVLGIPFKFSAAIALLAISAVLFLDWDRRRHGRAVAGRAGYGSGAGIGSGSFFAGSNAMEPRVTHVRNNEEHMHTSFGPVKLHAGRFEEGPTGHKFIPYENTHLIKEE